VENPALREFSYVSMKRGSTVSTNYSGDWLAWIVPSASKKKRLFSQTGYIRYICCRQLDDWRKRNRTL